jgi:hypothetical protein
MLEVGPKMPSLKVDLPGYVQFPVDGHAEDVFSRLP